MNEKSFVHMMPPVIVSCLLIVVAGGNAKSQVEESVSFTFGGRGRDWRAVRLQIPIKASESEKFLATPVHTLRAQGIQVPQPAEAPWREFTQALRRLISAENARSAGRRSSTGETITFTVVIRNSVRLLYVGTGETNQTDTANSRTAEKFLEDPVSTLRTKGAQIHAANERDWKQLADALKALKLAYNKPS